MEKIETDCIWVILKKVGSSFFEFISNRLDIKAVFSYDHLVCDLHLSLLSLKPWVSQGCNDN